MTKSKENKIDFLSLAVKVADRVNLHDVFMVQCQCSHEPQARSGKQILNYDCKVEAKLDLNEKVLLVFPSFELKGVKEREGNEFATLLIKATFLLIYALDDISEIDQNCAEAFGQVNGIYNAWPYWREFVQNTIARMGLPPLIVPTYRIFTPENKKTISFDPTPAENQ